MSQVRITYPNGAVEQGSEKDFLKTLEELKQGFYIPEHFTEEKIYQCYGILIERCEGGVE